MAALAGADSTWLHSLSPCAAVAEGDGAAVVARTLPPFCMSRATHGRAHVAVHIGLFCERPVSR